MGGLARKIPVTFVTFAIATAAIAGIPPLAGFFSKDEILWFSFASARGGSTFLLPVPPAPAPVASLFFPLPPSHQARGSGHAAAAACAHAEARGGVYVHPGGVRLGG